MTTPDFSILIVTRNTRELLRRALDSIHAEHSPCTREIIVVDNGSTDSTVEMLHADFPHVRLIASPTNLGFARANNLAATEAKGRWLCLMNSDARLKQNTLGELLPQLDSLDRCGVLGVQLLNTDGSRQNSVAPFPSLLTELLPKGLLKRLRPFHKKTTAPRPVDTVIGAFLVTPRALWQQLGGLDERYFFFFEETDYCRRVHNLGLRILHLPTVEVWHDQGQTAKQVNVQARIEYWKSREHYFAQHRPRWELAILQAGLLLRLLGTWTLNGIGQFLAPRYVDKFAVAHALFIWHLKGKPRSWGLSPQ